MKIKKKYIQHQNATHFHLLHYFFKWLFLTNSWFSGVIRSITTINANKKNEKYTNKRINKRKYNFIQWYIVNLYVKNI